MYVEKMHTRVEKELRGALCNTKASIDVFKRLEPRDTQSLSDRLSHAETWLMLLLAGLVVLSVLHTSDFTDATGRQIECSPIMYCLYFWSTADKSDDMRKQINESLGFTVVVFGAIVLVLGALAVVAARR
jgi:hypothetical protein